MPNINELLFHPIRIRIVQHLAYLEAATVGTLSELMGDIPQTTLYRHINTLYDNGLLTIVREERIRGTYERMYALNLAFLKDVPSLEDIKKGVQLSLVRLMAGFEAYFKEENIDPVKDNLFLSENIILLSDDEFQNFKEALFDVIKRHMNFDASPARKQRSITIVSSPAVERREGPDEK